MKKIFIAFLLCMFSLLPSGFANEKLEVFYFWGIGCSHCEQIKPYMEGIESKYAGVVKFTNLEIFQNEINRQTFFSMMKSLGYEEFGTPTIIIGDKVIAGDKQIVSQLDDAIKTALSQEAFDYHKELKNAVSFKYYWRENCMFCEKAAPFIDNLQKIYGSNLTIEKINITDKNELKKFLVRMNELGINEDSLGTPTVEINGEVLVGLAAIQQKLPSLIEKAGAESPKNTKTLQTVTFTALVDSINPCAMMVLIVLLSSLMVYQKDNRKTIILSAIAFIVSVYCTYFVLGLGIVNLIVSTKITHTILYIVGGLAICIGLANIKDGLFYRKWNWAMEIPEAWRGRLNKVLLAVTSPMGAFTAGALVTMFELPCTGGPYLFGLSLISTYGTHMEQILLLAYYNLIFVSPLILIAFCSIKGFITIEQAEDWRNKHVKTIHLLTGISMLLLGLYVIFVR